VTTTADESRALDEIKIGGLGSSRKRVEDDRFIRGKGNYTDDIVLPGMLHMEILRSPLAHARIKSIDASKAWEIPGVRMVLTGEMMATRNLAWMPTLSYDTQAVLATDKVRFQGQEVACVIADDPYIARDGCEVIVVDYEPLPVVVNPMQAVAPDAPVIRDDKENQHDNVIYDWEVGDSEGTDRAFAQADVISKLQLHYPRSHPSPIECCASIADFNRSTSKLTVYMTTQAPHIIRAAVALVAELPEHLIRIVSPDLGGTPATSAPSSPLSFWSGRSSGSRTRRATSSPPVSPETCTSPASWRCAKTARSSAFACTPRPTTEPSSLTLSRASSRSV
jgi:carbon-monoxide dehydrogenase large subunit